MITIKGTQTSSLIIMKKGHGGHNFFFASVSLELWECMLELWGDLDLYLVTN
jgi:hypothetical protein